MKRIAVDIGGTFTDIVYIDDTTLEMRIDKARSTPGDIGQAVMDAVRKTGVDISGVSLFIHGTTAGINTIVQKKGSKVGLITTQGFTDVLEMGRGNRKELYDYMWKKPKPLVPRYLRLGVNERITHRGEILREPDEAETRDIIWQLKESGVEAVAVCLLHSCANPIHEEKIGATIRETWPEVSLSLSHQVARIIREYERTSTTVINAYIEKAVTDYLSRLEENLANAGFSGQLLVLGPNGVLGIEAVRERAIHTLASGPIGGAAGAAHLAKTCGLSDVVTMDVGGTSFDVSIIKDGHNVERYQTEIMGYPVLMAGMDIRPIGAGGGSIARVDAGGLLTVGPDSAGAVPGPMAYGLGGTEPTVTDAALYNGIIDADYFLGGEIKLAPELAEQGIRTIAEKLGLPPHQAAEGILSVALTNMTTATTEILVGQGYDPRDFTLVSYGGGGGLFAAGLAREMSIAKVIIPVSPGVFSAQGILTMNLVHTDSRAYDRVLSAIDTFEMEGIFREMEEHARALLKSEGMSERDTEFTRFLDISYQGQRYSVETPIPGNLMDNTAAMQETGETFRQLYETRYGSRMELPLVTSNARLKATGYIKGIPVQEIRQGTGLRSEALKKPRQVFLGGILAEMPVYERAGLCCGNVIRGPAIIEEPFHTTVLLPGQVLQVDRWGNLLIGTEAGS